ncbi:MAG: response regulator transcription factor [Desulfobulbaceae bacterium]
MKIILCSTNATIRERWFSLLADQGYSLYQASSMQVLESLIHRNEPYLLLLHQHFSDLQTISTLCNKPESLKIFFLSDAPGVAEGLVLLQRGAVGYANTFIAAGRLLEAIRTVQAGRVWFSQEILGKLIQSINVSASAVDAKVDELLPSLTDREREIAILISDGLSNQAIGKQLYISDRTVKAHLQNIFKKIGVESRLQLALKIKGLFRSKQ